jgi:hypothetical protein
VVGLRACVSAVTVLAVGCLGVASAAPASAATTVTVTGSAITPWSVTDSAVTFANDYGSPILIASVALSCPGALDMGSGLLVQTGASQRCNIPRGMVDQVVMINNFVAIPIGSVQLTYRGRGAHSDAASPPDHRPILQQFGAPTAGTCAQSQPAGLDWSDVASGGWSESWAEWVNDGWGGAVCTRTLVYSESSGTWTVG